MSAEFADDQPVCSVCQMPAALTARGWEHAEPADAVFCSILRGGPLTIAEDEPDAEGGDAS